MANSIKDTSQSKIIRVADITLSKAALIAGLGLLIMTIAAIFAEATRTSLIVANNATATANNIMANQMLFRFVIISYLITAALDVVVAWALYIFLKPVNKNLSLLAGWFRVAYAAIFGASLFNLVNALELLNNQSYLKVFGANQLHNQVMISLNAFNNGWNVGFVLFGLHLGLLGYLALKSGYIPKYLGVLLIIAGLGYLADSFGEFLIADYSATIAMFTFVGELVLIFWLFFKGSKIPEIKS